MEVAFRALSRAGRRLVAAQPLATWRIKEDGTFLTELDLEIQASLKGPLLEAFPGCVFVGEEDPCVNRAAREHSPRLVLDPIDGTAPFARGMNCFSVSLALVDGTGEPGFAIVHMPARGRWYAGANEDSGWVFYDVEIVGERVMVLPSAGRHTEPSIAAEKDGYVYVSSNAMQALDLHGFEGKIRALGATASHMALLLDRTPDPQAVILTQYRLWDALAGLILALAAGYEVRDLRHPEEIFHLARFVTELVKQGETPPLIVGMKDTVLSLLQTIKHRGKVQ